MAKPNGFKTGTREAGTFLAIPHSVIDSMAYRALSVHSRAFLIDVARQYNGRNNGSLLASRSHMKPLGWKSSEMLTKCTRELLESRLLYLTVMGRRPNRAAWYAVTWQKLDTNAGYDAGAVEGFRRSAYKDGEPMRINVKPTREQLYRRWDQSEETKPLDRHTVQVVPQ